MRSGEYGAAINEIELTAFIPIPKDVEGGFLQSEDFSRFPTVRFMRKRQKIIIDFLSASFPAHLRDEDRVEQCNSAMEQFVGVLSLIEKRIKLSDDFETTEFLSDTKSVLQKGFVSLSEIMEIENQRRTIT